MWAPRSHALTVTLGFHVPAAEIFSIIVKYARTLAPGGTLFLNFKLGSNDGMRNGRQLIDLNEPAFRNLIAGASEPRINQTNVTSDAHLD